MFLQYFDFKYFLISFAIGLLYIYITDEYKKVIILYPHPHNLNKYTYKDKADNCFKYNLKKTKCPSKQENYVNVGVNY